MTTRSLGTYGPEVSAIGLGCSGMSGVQGVANDTESIATIHAALDSGITLIDTADFYGMGHNELVIREASRGRAREQVVISDKFGGCAVQMAALLALMVVLPLLRISLPILCADLAPSMWTFIVLPALILTYPLKRPLALSRIW